MDGQVSQLPGILALAAGPRLSTVPRRFEIDGYPVVAYARTRFHLDRDACESVPEEGILLVQVFPAGGRRRAYAITRAELESDFGQIRATRSWDTGRAYNWPTIPSRASKYELRLPGECEAPAEHAAVPRATIARPAVVRTPCAGADQQSAISWAWRVADSVKTQRESAEYLRAVDAWRSAWRPARVRVLLIAESHVAEQPGDAGVVVTGPDPGLPSSFCRLVYCLGYGDSSICQPAPSSSNRGTPQYWELFARIAAGAEPCAVPRTVDQKIAVLRKLMDLGVWLVDASIVGIYRSGGFRLLQGAAYPLVLRQSFLRYVVPTVVEDRPEIVCVIGKTVYAALVGLPLITKEWIYQPNARGKVDEHREQVLALAARINARADERRP